MKDREIKFRVWNIKIKGWMNHCAVIDCNGNIGSHFVEIKDDQSITEHMVGLSKEDNIVQQFTGLKDKNNKEIYEGDIIKRVHYEDSLYIVVWNEDGYYWRGTHETDKEFIEYRASPYNRDRLIDGIKNCEVIGNIMENPELLKEYEKNQTSNVA